jgi:hypothetical protein
MYCAVICTSCVLTLTKLIESRILQIMLRLLRTVQQFIKRLPVYVNTRYERSCLDHQRGCQVAIGTFCVRACLINESAFQQCIICCEK